jgi:hypothetical protein
MMSTLRHPNVQTLLVLLNFALPALTFDFSSQGITFRPQLCVVTELAPYGSLSDVLLREDLALSWDTIAVILRQIGAPLFGC